MGWEGAHSEARGDLRNDRSRKICVEWDPPKALSDWIRPPSQRRFELRRWIVDEKTAAARDPILEWKDLADLGRICLVVSKGGALAALARPMAKGGIDGLKNFLDGATGSLELDQQDHA